MDVFIGTVMPFPYNFVPRGWLACNGQILPIVSYTALFSLIGTYYGGNGQTNFALPHLNTTSNQVIRVAAGQGTGPGLTPRSIGQPLGTDTVTLLSTQLPRHDHPMTVYGSIASRSAVPTAGGAMVDPSYNGFVAPTPPPVMVPLSPSTVLPAGGNQAHPNDQPVLSLYFCIAYEGTFPSFG